MSPESEKRRLCPFILGIGIVLVVGLVVGASLYLGRRKATKAAQSRSRLEESGRLGVFGVSARGIAGRRGAGLVLQPRETKEFLVKELTLTLLTARKVAAQLKSAETFSRVSPRRARTFSR